MSTLPVYRMVKTRWRGVAFDGTGARLYGGRWNSRGRPATYVAGSEALAILEILVHLDRTAVLPSYTVFELSLPREEIGELPAKALPANWQASPAPQETAEIGDEWLASGEGLALALPSVVVPTERTYLLNPAHPLYGDVVAVAVERPVELDPRLLGPQPGGVQPQVAYQQSAA